MGRTAATLLLAASLLSTGCMPDEPFETEPRAEHGSFGEEAFEILREESRISEHSPAARVAALDARRDDLVWALDRLVRDGVGERMLDVLEAYVPLYEDAPDGSPAPIPSLTKDLARVVDGALSGPGVVAALAELEAAFDPVPPSVYRLLRRVVLSPADVLAPLSEFLTAREAPIQDMQADLAARLLAFEPSKHALAERLLAALLEPAPAPLPDLGAPAWSVEIDDDGLPKMVDGLVPPPLVDADADGRPDRAPDGRMLRVDGGVGAPSAFSWRSEHGENRDTEGRAISMGGSPLYRYVDLRHTTLGYGLISAHGYAQSGALHDLLRALHPLLGPLWEKADGSGSYLGYQVEGSPLDMWLRIAIEVLSYERLPEALAALAAVDRARPDLLPGLLEDVARVRARFAGRTILTPGNTLADDLLVHAASLAEGGVLRAVLAALGDNRSLGLKTALPDMLTYTGLIIPDVSKITEPEQVDHLTYAPPVDRSLGDGAPANQSIMQRVAELVNDTDGARYVATILGQSYEQLLVTESLAYLYVESMAGYGRLGIGDIPDYVVEALLGAAPEFDDLTPTAEQLNLFIAHDQALLGNPMCNQGFPVREHRGYALMEFQRTGGLAAFRPLAEAHVSMGHTQDFVDLMGILHEHYSAEPHQRTGSLSRGTGIRNAEVDLIDLVGTTHIIENVSALSSTLSEVKLHFRGEQLSAIDEVAGLLTFLLQPAPELIGLLPEVPLKGDGSLAVQDKLSLLGVLLYAARETERAIEADPVADAAWEAADLLGPILDLDGESLKNPAAAPLARAAISSLASFAEKRVTDQTRWRADLAEIRADVIDLLGSRTARRLLVIAAELREEEALRAEIDTFLANLLSHTEPGPGADGHAALVGALAWLSQCRIEHDALAEVAHWAGAVLAQNPAIITRLLRAVDRVQQRDPGRVLNELLANATEEPEPARIPLRLLSSAFKSLLRVDPAEDGPFTTPDMYRTLESLRDYLVDDQRGMERLYEVARNRK